MTRSLTEIRADAKIPLHDFTTEPSAFIFDALRDRVQLLALVDELGEALSELHAMVWGECPSTVEGEP
jgi:hypothetical protein